MNKPANPYQPPAEMSDQPAGKRKSLLRYIVAATMGLLGMAAFAMGVLVIIVWYRFVFVEDDTTHLLELIAACLLYFSLTTCWLLSAMLTWRADYRRAVTLGIIGLAILVAIFTVAGF